jgi:N-methylhydantoinase A
VGSAVGLLGTDLSTDRVLTRVRHESSVDFADLDATYVELAAAAAADLGVALEDSSTRVTRSVDVRLAGQAHELTVEVPGDAWDADTLAALRTAFYARYREAYGIAAGGAVELVSYRVRVTRVVPKVPLGRRPTENATGGHGGVTRPVWFAEYGDYRPTPVHDRDSLAGVGGPVVGPLIVVDHESTVVVPPGWSARTDDAFDVVLTRVQEEQ